jgi:hypothetical protein
MAFYWYDGQEVSITNGGANGLRYWYDGLPIPDSSEGTQEVTGSTIPTAESFGNGVVKADHNINCA